MSGKFHDQAVEVLVESARAVLPYLDTLPPCLATEELRQALRDFEVKSFKPGDAVQEITGGKAWRILAVQDESGHALCWDIRGKIAVFQFSNLRN